MIMNAVTAVFTVAISGREVNLRRNAEAEFTEFRAVELQENPKADVSYSKDKTRKLSNINNMPFSHLNPSV